MKQLEMVEINKSKQWIYVREKNKDNPIILFLHGGPGMSQIYCADKYFEKLEEHFIVVDWDQRCSGKSYHKRDVKQNVTIDQYVEDIKVLSEHLMNRFHKDKIFLIGHSWGSIIGLLAVDKYPNLFHRYIGIGQVINMIEGEKRGYNFALEQSKMNDELKNYKRLLKLGPPPYDSIFKTAQFRKILEVYGGFEYEKKMNLWNDIKDMLASEHYRFMDIYKWFKGINYLTRHLRNEIMAINFFEQVQKIEIPVYFISGKYDYITPISLTEEYVEMLESPYKKMIVFEKAAHDCHFEKSDQFVDVCINILEEWKN